MPIRTIELLTGMDADAGKWRWMRLRTIELLTGYC